MVSRHRLIFALALLTTFWVWARAVHGADADEFMRRVEAKAASLPALKCTLVSQHRSSRLNSTATYVVELAGPYWASKVTVTREGGRPRSAVGFDGPASAGRWVQDGSTAEEFIKSGADPNAHREVLPQFLSAVSPPPLDGIVYGDAQRTLAEFFADCRASGGAANLVTSAAGNPTLVFKHSDTDQTHFVVEYDAVELTRLNLEAYTPTGELMGKVQAGPPTVRVGDWAMPGQVTLTDVPAPGRSSRGYTETFAVSDVTPLSSSYLTGGPFTAASLNLPAGSTLIRTTPDGGSGRVVSQADGSFVADEPRDVRFETPTLRRLALSSSAPVLWQIWVAARVPLLVLIALACAAMLVRRVARVRPSAKRAG